MRKTLLAVSSAVLLSMLLAPHGGKGGVEGWGPFFSTSGFDVGAGRVGHIGRVMIDMLALEMIFLAVLFAVIANIRWRPSRRVVIWSTLCATLLLIVGFGLPAFQQQMKVGAEREEWMALGDIDNGKFDSAKEHLLKAAKYCWWKGWWDGARNAKQRAFDVQGMQIRAAIFRANNDQEDARRLLRVRNVFDQFGPWRAFQPGYPDDESVTEAKRLLLDAAEQWHIAGDAGSEERVRTWEKNVTTKAELLASLPHQASGKYVSTDPNAAKIQSPSSDIFDDLIPKAKPATSEPDVWRNELPVDHQWKSEEQQCSEPLHYPPVKWDHQTEFGKTFAIVKFRERKAGDRKTQLENYTKAIGAKFYKQWSRVRQGGADWVEVVFYK